MAAGQIAALEGALRWVPVATGLAFIGYFFVGRALQFRLRYGRSPIHVPSRDDHSAQAFTSRALIGFFVAIVLLGLFAAIAPGTLERLDPLYRWRSPALLGAGVLMMLLSAAVVLRGQEDMAEAWRIGIDAGEQTRLITVGIFRFCRNPIYLGLHIALAGFFCMIPGYFTVTLIATAFVLFQVQARLEEAYLLTKHGESYVQYCQQVGRFLPWLGRWRPVAPPREGP